MTYHNGKIMPSVYGTPIFWGKSWPNYTSDEVTGIDLFYQGMSASNYAKTVDEYKGTNGTVGNSMSFHASVIDGSAASGGGSTAAILNEVAKEITAGVVALDATGNGYYPVYTDLPRGNAGYCAWHSSGTIGSTTVQFAFFWKLDGDPGCDPNSTVSGQSEGLAASANVSAHELSEARSDPGQGGWYDAQGNENGDKCAWTFGAASVTVGSSQWKLQGEWSNAAYSTGTGGYPNSKGQKGCLAGQ